jgi:hypothetical protein
MTTVSNIIEEINQKKWNDTDALGQLRLVRNVLLSETDWMANSDVTMSDAWKTYRQELRDITKTFNSINDKDFAFPTKPTE